MSPSKTDPAPRPIEAETRERFAHLLALPTRWMDNDTYGHINNVVYYALFDTIINRYLIEEGGLDIAAGPVIGLVVETKCQFKRPVGFPDVVEMGLRVARVGTSSVSYECGVFAAGRPELCAFGHVVHVFVDRGSRRPTPIPARLRAALERLLSVR